METASEKRIREAAEMAETLKEVRKNTGILGREIARLKEFIADIRNINQMAR